MVAGNEQPPKNWQTLVGSRSNRFGDGLFYFFKVWFTESGVTTQDIKKSYPIFAFKNNDKVMFELRYGYSNPTIQFTIVTTQDNKMKADFVFPLNNCLFNADYNNDDILDEKDVTLAKETTKIR